MKRERTKGLDAIPTILYSNNEQLRVLAIARMTTLREERLVAVKAADEAYISKEREYLEAVSVWKRTASQGRATAAYAVGELQRDLAKAGETRQLAMYPYRFIQSHELIRAVIDPDTRDTRKIPHPVFVGHTMATNATDRTILL